MHQDVELADRMLARLADLLRLTLDNAGLQEVPLQQELEHLNAYVAIQIVRFRGRLLLETDVADELLACRVPNLLLQPLVENIVKHAVAPNQRVVHARVQARREGGQLRVEITDDGPGLPAGEALREGIGLANTRGRLQRLYGEDQALTLVNRYPAGTTTTIVLPYRMAAGDIDVEAITSSPELDHVAHAHR